MGNVIDHFHSHRTGASQDGRVIIPVYVAEPFTGDQLLGMLFRLSNVSTKNDYIGTESLQIKEQEERVRVRLGVFQISTYVFIQQHPSYNL
jgi:hypothetical protein